MSGDPGPLHASLHDALLWELPQSTAPIKHRGPFTKLELACILDIYTIIIDPSNQWVIQPSEELVARLISDHFVSRVPKSVRTKLLHDLLHHNSPEAPSHGEPFLGGEAGARQRLASALGPDEPEDALSSSDVTRTAPRVVRRLLVFASYLKEMRPEMSGEERLEVAAKVFGPSLAMTEVEDYQGALEAARRWLKKERLQIAHRIADDA